MTFFDGNEVEDMDFDVVPPGQYLVIVEECEMRDTKSGDGQYCFVQLGIVSDGPQSGRKIFQNFNLVNPNEVAERIGKSQFKSFINALGYTVLKSEDQLAELIDQTLEVKVSVTKRKDNGDDQNVIKKFIAREGATSAASQAVQNYNDANQDAPPAAPQQQAGGRRKMF